jgi:hypothetical protein
MGSKTRDVEIIPLEGEQCLVVACDSCGAVGTKELDAVRAPLWVVGRYTARVALFEVLAAGAEIKAVSVAISNEPSPTGEEILRGVREELSGLEAKDIPTAISTEKNMATRQTAVGVTVVGVCRKRDLRLARSRPGDIVYCLGTPKVGDEVGGPDDDTAVQLKHLATLLKWEGVHDVIPVGSRGIRWEAETLSDAVGRKLVLEPQSGLDLDKSAGPCTCIVLSCLPDSELPDFDAIPLARIGRIDS